MTIKPANLGAGTILLRQFNHLITQQPAYMGMIIMWQNCSKIYQLQICSQSCIRKNSGRGVVLATNSFHDSHYLLLHR